MLQDRIEKEGVNLDDILESNRSLVIRQLRLTGGCSRVELSRATGLTQATITKIIRAMREWGLVEEIGTVSGKRGRRSIILRLNGAACHVIGIRFVRDVLRYSVCDLEGRRLVCRELPLGPEEAGERLLAFISELVAETVKEYADIKAIGIAVPGPYLKKEGEIQLVTKQNRWKNINLPVRLSELTGLPVFVEHDSLAGALAYYWREGIKKGREVIVHISIGTGVGAGLCIGGVPYSGSQGIAGEIGHISIDYNGIPCECGNNGCIEKYCSTTALEARVRRRLPENRGSILNEEPSEITAEAVFRAANESKDAFALRMLEETGMYIAQAIMLVVMAYDPDSVVVSGSMTSGGPVLLESIRSHLKKHLMPYIYDKLEVTFSPIEQDIALHGAATVAINGLFAKPTKNFMVEGG